MPRRSRPPCPPRIGTSPRESRPGQRTEATTLARRESGGMYVASPEPTRTAPGPVTTPSRASQHRHHPARPRPSRHGKPVDESRHRRSRAGRSQSRRRRSAVASKPQKQTHAPESNAGPSSVDRKEHDLRISLVRRVSGGRLNRLGEPIRREQDERRGGRCVRLKAGSVDCTCDYCWAFWAQLKSRVER